MSNNIAFFSVHADDLPRRSSSMERSSAGSSSPGARPGFFLVATGDKDNPGIEGSLQKRHEVVPGKKPLRV